MFRKTVTPTLAERHQSADRKAEEALDVFRAVTATLNDSIGEHRKVAAEASEQIEALEALRVEATAAAADKARRADAIAALTH